MLGVMGGIPASVVTFIVLCVACGHPDRKKGTLGIQGGLLGMGVWLIASACAALMVLWGKNPWIAFVGIFVVSAISCVLYARSSPKA
jgi:lipopolysaccharide export LptBFGC system permease protein LptF